MSIPDSQWRHDGKGVLSNADCGGDIQAGESFSVRYVRPGRRATITVSFYPVEYDELPGEFIVQRQVEWYLGGPDGDEIWSDVDYDDVSLVMDTAAEAEQEARDFANGALTLGDTHGWDGQPDYQNGAA